MTLTLDRHAAVLYFTGLSLRVFVDGVDVTARCYESNHEEGWATCYQLNEYGKEFVNPATGVVAQERLTGQVTYTSNREQ